MTRVIPSCALSMAGQTRSPSHTPQVYHSPGRGTDPAFALSLNPDRTDPAGDTGRSETSFQYDPDSNLASSTNGRGNSSFSAFDKLGRLSSSKNSLEDSMRFFYDREGNTRRSEDFKGVRVSASIYDALSRTILDERAGERGAPPPSVDCPTDEHDEPPALGAAAVVTRMRHDPNGNAIEVLQGGAAGAAGVQLTQNRFDSRNNLVKTTSAIEDITSVNFYDPNDNLRGSISRGAGGEFRGASLNELDQRNRLRKTAQFLTDIFSGEDENAVIPETFAPGGGLVTSFRYDRDNNRTGTRDPRGNLSQTTYDARDRVVDTIDARGFIISRVEYNENDLRVKVFGQDASNPFPGAPPAAGNLALLQRFEYNGRNELKKQTDASGDVVEFFYDENGNLALQIDQAGVRRTSEYDVLDRLVKQVEDEGPGPGRLNITTRFQYDANGNRAKIVDPKGFEYVFAYDQANRMIRLSYPQLSDGTIHEEFWGYDRFGRMSFHLDANGKLACFEYDLLNRLVKESHGSPFDVEIVREYDTVGNLVRIDHGTVATRYSHDAISRMTGVDWLVGGEPFRSLSYQYDAASNRIRMTGPESASVPEETGYTYDADNRPVDITRTEPGGASPTRLMIRHVYTSGGLLARKELGNGVHETRSYDKEQRLVQIRAFRTSDSVTLTRFDYTYDERDDRTQVVLAHFNTTAKFSYDAVQRLVREVWTGDISFFGEYGYDPNGNRLFKANSQVGLRIYEYDEENRLVRETKSVQAELDLSPSQIAVSSTAAGFSKDPIVDGKISPQIKPGKAWKSEDLPGQQHFVQVQFDAPVLLDRITFWVPFDAKGKGKDEDDEDHEAKHVLVERFKIQAFVDEVFQDVSIQDLQGPQANTASPGWLKTRHFRNRIEFVPVLTSKIRFLQDAGGGSKDAPDSAVMSELRLRGFVSDADKAGEILYEYDANGNQIKRTEDGTEESFAYDYANRLAAYTKRHVSGGDGEGHGKGKGKGHDIGKGKGHDKDEDDDGDGPGGIREAFTYLFAPTGERIAKRDIKRRRSEFYMYDGQDIVADYVPKKHGGFQVTVEYTNALSIDSKVARIDPEDGDRLFYHGDALNSVNALVDDAGRAENQQLTNAWGEALVADQETADRYGFTQRENDPESGLMHFRARGYDPRLGRFIQRDPTSRVLEPYPYASNSPSNRIDPTGGQDQDPNRFRNDEQLRDFAAKQKRNMEYIESLGRLQRNQPDREKQVVLDFEIAQLQQENLKLALKVKLRRFFLQFEGTTFARTVDISAIQHKYFFWVDKLRAVQENQDLGEGESHRQGVVVSGGPGDPGFLRLPRTVSDLDDNTLLHELTHVGENVQRLNRTGDKVDRISSENLVWNVALFWTFHAPSFVTMEQAFSAGRIEEARERWGSGVALLNQPVIPYRPPDLEENEKKAFDTREAGRIQSQLRTMGIPDAKTIGGKYKELDGELWKQVIEPSK